MQMVCPETVLSWQRVQLLKVNSFVGWRFDSGPKSFKGVCYVLDYDAIKQQIPGYQIALTVPFEEIYVPEGSPVLPLKAAADRALTLFSEPSPEDIQPIEVPFSELPRDA